MPVEGRVAPEAEIGEDDEIVVQVLEEVVVSKRVVIKEEIHLRKRWSWMRRSSRWISAKRRST
jgi:Domain of unknown function (DUF2382)